MKKLNEVKFPSPLGVKGISTFSAVSANWAIAAAWFPSPLGVKGISTK